MVRVNGNVAEFSFYRPDAQQVHLAGDFNGWSGEALSMVRAADGHWWARLRLGEGEYRFRYCADGEWFVDYAAFGLEPGPFGPDSVLRVTAAEAAAPQADRADRPARPSAAA